ncbi:histone H1-like [Olea europaea subsp. europaea]|uniref:Histone H1-like n=1 Tax=Olea europaea subsp. europaea TaxID=158383 RepID=A0A8S0RHU2_OLEEU|nr:histone H1-like [Olea europaea subsp. europaea]
MAVSKKNSTTKTTSSSSSPSNLHPPYLQMISEAITTMKDRAGSSQPAIAKFIEVNYTASLPANFKKILSAQLKRFVKSEKLVKVKNSYKISPSEKVKRPANSVENKTHRKKGVKNVATKTTGSNKEVVKKDDEKAKKTKRLSQVKTPEALKKKIMGKKNVKGSVTEGKLKKSSQVKSCLQHHVPYVWTEILN